MKLAKARFRTHYNGILNLIMWLKLRNSLAWDIVKVYIFGRDKTDAWMKNPFSLNRNKSYRRVAVC